jgi:mannosyltransferase OCH1-like enzyme
MKITIDECLSGSFKKESSDKPLIPRVIHQTHTLPLEELRPCFRAQINIVRTQNPTFEHRFYNDLQCEEFIKKRYGSEMFAVYNSINPEYGPARADLFRYLLLYADGGVYLDAKSGTSMPLESIIADDDEYLISNWCHGKCGNKKECEGECGRVNWEWLLNTGFGEYQQWWLACRPRHPFLLAVIHRCLANIEAYKYDPCDKTTFGKEGVLNLTGPIAYTKAIFPIVSKYSHRFKTAAFGGKFVYSFGTDYGYEHVYEHVDGKTHYSKLTSPIVIHI